MPNRDDGFLVWGRALPLIFAPALVLRTKCAPVAIDVMSNDELKDVRRTMADMVATVVAYDALGLAAPQVGIGQRLIVIRSGANAQPKALINPTITMPTGRMGSTEGCLSLPGQRRRVRRAQTIVLTAHEISVGIEKEVVITAVSWKLSGLAACIAQHEVDHLNGVLLNTLPQAF
jgi:peptide deformylase